MIDNTSSGRSGNEVQPTARPAWLTDAFPELRQGPPWVMEEMIAAEPRLVAPILSHEAAGALAGMVREAYEAGSPIVTTGCGTSEHGALAVAGLLQSALSRLGAPPGRVESREAFDAMLDPRAGGVLLAVSHEGGTVATLEAIRAARASGARTILFTAKPGAPGASLADHVLVTPLLDGSWCHTVAYVSAILAGAAVAAALAGEPLDPDQLSAYLNATLHLDQAIPVGRALAHCSRLIVTGLGPDLISARELALKIEEGARLPATAIQLETLLHGHFGAVDEHAGVVFVLCSDVGGTRRDRRARFAAEALRRIGARCGAILGSETVLSEGVTDAGRIALPPDPVTNGPVGALACVLTASAIALQKLTVALAHARGCNPDLIRREEEPYRDAARIAEKGY
jgi:glutamine---fructose-6-phosphate transaminase (isomerizing)